MQENGEQSNLVLTSEMKLEKPKETESSENLLKNVSMRLYGLMMTLTETDVNAKSVNAACNCASEIHKLLKLNIEMKKSTKYRNEKVNQI